MPNDPAYRDGLKVRKRVLGTAYVERALSGATGFDRDWQEFVTRHAWGAVWTRAGLEPRIRSLLTIAILAALGREDELGLHLSATRNTGATPGEIAEALMHVAVYAGVPAANSAFKIAKSVLAELDSQPPNPSAPLRTRARRGAR